MSSDSLTRRQVSVAFDRYGTRWAKFQADLQGGGRQLLREAFELVREHECLSALAYRVRAEMEPSHPYRRDVEETFAELSFSLAALQKPASERGARREWHRKYRRIWHENLSLFLLTVVIFLSGGVLGAFAVMVDPANAAALMPQSMMEDVIEKRRWFDMLQSNPVLLGLQIAINNIKVCIMCFTLGAVFGVGGVAILIYNGALLGATIAFCRVHGFDDQLVGFIISHGPLELTIIVASAFCSLLVGRAFYLSRTLFPARMSLAGNQASVVMAGILPWLVVAACLEAGVSPWPWLDADTKLTLGAAVGAAFLAWSLWPVSDKRTR